MSVDEISPVKWGHECTGVKRGLGVDVGVGDTVMYFDVHVVEMDFQIQVGPETDGLPTPVY